jgi:sugar lactone lactonase YvrE
MRRFVVVSASLLAAAAALLALPACTGGGLELAADDAGPRTDAGCPTVGTGTLNLNVTGLPPGVLPRITLESAAGTRTAGVAGANALPAHGYRVTADPVAVPDPIVRKAYLARVSTPVLCVGGARAESVDVTYAEIASSNKLWLTNANGANPLLGFASASLGATGSPAATVSAAAPSGRGVAFDREGNLWSFGPTTADPQLVRYPAAALGASGAKEADRKIDLGIGCSPPTSALAFDKDGNLWATSACDKKATRVTASELGASGRVTPSVAIAGMTDPQGIAFDKDGNMWIADLGGRLARYDASRLAASSSDAPSLALSPKATAGGAALPPTALAFDKDGNLWAANFGGNVIYKIAPADLAGAGARDVVPPVQITVAVAALLEAIAIDESGGLWLTYTQGKVARLAPAQLGTSSGAGSPTTPDTIVTSADIGSAGAMAFFPAPAALPIYARLP